MINSLHNRNSNKISLKYFEFEKKKKKNYQKDVVSVNFFSLEFLSAKENTYVTIENKLKRKFTAI